MLTLCGFWTNDSNTLECARAADQANIQLRSSAPECARLPSQVEVGRQALGPVDLPYSPA